MMTGENVCFKGAALAFAIASRVAKPEKTMAAKREVFI